MSPLFCHSHFRRSQNLFNLAALSNFSRLSFFLVCPQYAKVGWDQGPLLVPLASKLQRASRATFRCVFRPRVIILPPHPGLNTGKGWIWTRAVFGKCSFWEIVFCKSGSSCVKKSLVYLTKFAEVNSKPKLFTPRPISAGWAFKYSRRRHLGKK